LYPVFISRQVLHYHFDHPKVSSVVLSNNILDAAKTNRTLQLLQSAISQSDLQALAKYAKFEIIICLIALFDYLL
jgi:hypothetical protein